MSDSDAGDGTNADVSRTKVPAGLIAFTTRGFPVFLVGNFCLILGTQMQTTAVYWDLYERTGRAGDLAIAGIAQFLPVLLFTLIGGRCADLFNRKVVLWCGLFGLFVASLGLYAVSQLRLSPGGWGAVWTIYAALFVSGMARAFVQPAKASFLPLIVPPAHFTNAMTWNMGTFQLASVVGPVLAGWLLAKTRSASTVYLIDAVLIAAFAVALVVIPARQSERASRLEPMFTAIREGLAFTWSHPVIMAAISLDMFAVLLGGATALYPVYAKDILAVGPDGLGWMRGSMAVGALCMSLGLAFYSPMQSAGRTLIWVVAGFGLATMLFGLSRSYPISLALLFAMGALDMVSVVIRHTLVQTQTPDQMRGRVSAVNGIFIGASNELGAAESGFVAEMFARDGDPAFGPTVSVVSGGVGTLLVVALVARAWPELGRWRPAGGEPADR
jgi:MFS family permease